MFFNQMFDLVVVDIICAEELRVSYKPHYGSGQGNVQWPHSGMERCRSVSPYFISCRVFQGNPVVGGGSKESVCQDKVISDGAGEQCNGGDVRQACGKSSLEAIG